MFEYLNGKLAYKGLDYCVIDVGGVGFRVNTTASVASRIGNTGETVTLYTHLNVKEDELSLFGFASREELSSFEMLLGVSGVGPKVALAILNTLSPSDFSLAVAKGDFKAIAKSKGVGPKLAQRIILELKDKVAKDIQTAGADSGEDFEPIPQGFVAGDAISALMVLGYSSKEASDSVRKVFKDGMTLEETVRLALRNV